MANSRSVYEKVTTNNEESIDTKSRHTKHFRYNSSLSSKVPTQENRNYKTFKKIKQNLTFNEECFMEGVYAL